MAFSEEELAELLDELESDTVERKSSLKDPDEVCKVICAFANDLPGHRRTGVIFVGVDPKGTPTGLPITDELLTQIGGMRSNGNILPPPSLFVRKVHLKGSDVLVIEVPPSFSPPVRYNGRTWIRVGPRKATATEAEEKVLRERRRASDRPFDSQPVHGAALDDLDLDRFRRDYLPTAFPRDVLDENGRSELEQLSSLRFVGEDDTPTVAGLLVIGIAPTQFLPGAYVQFLRVAGLEMGEPIKDAKQLTTSLLDLPRQLEELCTLNISVATDLTSGEREIQQPDYPLVALREVTRNALLHRSYDQSNAPVRVTWYDDRVEIVSPGGPYGLVTRENFGRPGITDYRNPTLAEAMRALGYVQRFGYGLALARDALAKNGNPPAEWDLQQGFVACTVRARR